MSPWQDVLDRADDNLTYIHSMAAAVSNIAADIRGRMLTAEAKDLVLGAVLAGGGHLSVSSRKPGTSERWSNERWSARKRISRAHAYASGRGPLFTFSFC